MTVKLTDRLVQSLEPGKYLFDALVPGFGIRAYGSGKRSFFFEASIKGKPSRRVAIGSYPSWSLEAARKIAASYRVIVDNDGDPFEEKPEKSTLNDAWERYQKDHLPKLGKASGRDISSMWKSYILPQLSDKALDEITYSMIEKLHFSITHADLAKPKFYRANRVYESLRRVLNLCIKWEWLEQNPCKGIEVNREEPRSSFLPDSQVQAILTSLPGTESGDVIRILFMTGARVGEVLSMEWEHVDLEQGIWTKPAATTKQKRVHRVALSDAALAVIKGRPRIGKLVFCRPDGAPIKDIRKTWSWAFKRAGVPLVRIHDARHTVASLLVNGGATLYVVGQVLGHSNPSVTSRYTHLEDAVARKALNGLRTRTAQEISE